VLWVSIVAGCLAVIVATWPTTARADPGLLRGGRWTLEVRVVGPGFIVIYPRLLRSSVIEFCTPG